jgi:hypothetical protein
MSKKNRYKFRDRDRSEAMASGSAVTPAPAVARGSTDGLMAAHADEYRVISRDLIRLVLLNGLMFAVVLVVYFTNRSSGYLERIFERLF